MRLAGHTVESILRCKDEWLKWRDILDDKFSIEELAEIYGITRQACHFIATNHGSQSRSVSEEDAREIRKRYKAWRMARDRVSYYSPRWVGERLGVGQTTVLKYYKGGDL